MIRKSKYRIHSSDVPEWLLFEALSFTCTLYVFISLFLNIVQTYLGRRTGLEVRASDSGSGDPGSILGRVGVFVSLSKRHLLPKSTGNTQE